MIARNKWTLQCQLIMITINLKLEGSLGHKLLVIKIYKRIRKGNRHRNLKEKIHQKWSLKSDYQRKLYKTTKEDAQKLSVKRRDNKKYNITAASLKEFLMTGPVFLTRIRGKLIVIIKT